MKGTHVIRIEDQWVRSTLRPTPEWLAGARQAILGKTEQQLLNLVVVITLKLESGPSNTLLEGEGLLGNQEVEDLFNLLLLLTGVLESVLEVVGIGEVGIDGLDGFDKEIIELHSGPLNRVVDGVGEVLDCT